MVDEKLKESVAWAIRNVRSGSPEMLAEAILSMPAVSDALANARDGYNKGAFAAEVLTALGYTYSPVSRWTLPAEV